MSLTPTQIRLQAERRERLARFAAAALAPNKVVASPSVQPIGESAEEPTKEPTKEPAVRRKPGRPARALSQHEIDLIANIKLAVCMYYNISIVEFASKVRTEKLVHPRHIALYLAHTMTTLSCPALAKLFNYSHYTSVLAGVDKIAGRIEVDPVLAAQVAALREKLS